MRCFHQNTRDKHTYKVARAPHIVEWQSFLSVSPLNTSGLSIFMWNQMGSGMICCGPHHTANYNWMECLSFVSGKRAISSSFHQFHWTSKCFTCNAFRCVDDDDDVDDSDMNATNIHHSTHGWEFNNGKLVYL